MMQTHSLLQLRWARFRRHRMGYYSLWLFILIFVLSMMANLIANDRPLLVHYQDRYYLPVMHDYPETTYGGIFETAADYRDPVVQALIEQHGWMVWPLIRFADQTPNLALNRIPAPPSSENWLGTDDQGRDVLARILYGLRISILFGLGLTLLGSLLGIAVGALQGYYGGLVDLIGQRLIEVWSGLPQLFTTMILVSLFTPSIYWLFAIMLMFGWVTLVGIVRAEFLRARNQDYVLAARALGAGDVRIIFRHILPNVLSSTLSQLPFILTANITALSTLDFLGYGLPLGSPSLGELFSQAHNNLDAPWLVLSAFISMALLLSALLFIGEAARDAFDPRNRY